MVDTGNESLDNVAKYIARFDLNGDGMLGFEEFESIMDTDPNTLDPSGAGMRQAFREADENGDGKVCHSQLRRWLSKISMHPLPTDVAGEIADSVLSLCDKESLDF
eukprot:TRINITY_DN5342_c0_g1_i1.p1 TRINITY_DN5342_c0_g1~~TRINITY_DN5342_c0_g1_i1.p1  ORF type:complete len:106 (+),score=17.30 TRINITY_DN5342_c0_g1_i1:144-461(+)